MNAFVRLALVAAGLWAIPFFADAQAPDGAVVTASHGIGPRIQFNTENYDFDKILSGHPVKYTFIATNTGDATLEISNAKGSCTCTVVGDGPNKNVWTLQKVEPGQICRIPIEIETANFAGQKLSKFVSVTSNDKTRPVVNLQIHGSIWMPLEVVPQMAVFHLAGDAGSNTPQVIKIYNRMETPLVLSAPTVSTNVFSATLKTNVPGQEFELTVTAAAPPKDPPITATTTIQGTISLNCSCPQMSPLQVGVYEIIAPEITVYPAAGMQLIPGPLPQPITNLVAIRGSSMDLKLSEPAINASGVSLSVLTVQTNRQYNIFVVFPKGFEVAPDQKVALTVKTDNPRFPVVSVPVTTIRRGVPSPRSGAPGGAAQINASARVNPAHP